MIIGSQEAIFHDCGFAAGFFHIFDHFQTDDLPLSGRRIDVFLPRDYGQSRNRYPVLYMNDGGTAFVPGGLVNESWNMADAIERLYEMGKISQLIVVAIYPLSRAWEYTHAAWTAAKLPEDWIAYAHCVADCIKPFMDRFYRTLPDPKSTMVLGSSHGGLAAFYIANCRPTAFGFAAALSPSFWVGLDDGSFFPWVKPSLHATLEKSELVERVKHTLSDGRQRPRLYLGWGLVRAGGASNACIEERATARCREMVALLQHRYGYRMGDELVVYEDPEGKHDEQSWARQAPKVLEFFLGKS
jgi:predicted alpha/beta superfamily hydrolase